MPAIVLGTEDTETQMMNKILSTEPYLLLENSDNQ